MADSNILRIGKISSINYPEGTARISYEDKDGNNRTAYAVVAENVYFGSNKKDGAQSAAADDQDDLPF